MIAPDRDMGPELSQLRRQFDAVQFRHGQIGNHKGKTIISQQQPFDLTGRITSYNVCYTKLLRFLFNIFNSSEITSDVTTKSNVAPGQLMKSDLQLQNKSKDIIIGIGDNREDSYNFV